LLVGDLDGPDSDEDRPLRWILRGNNGSSVAQLGQHALTAAWADARLSVNPHRRTGPAVFDIPECPLFWTLNTYRGRRHLRKSVFARAMPSFCVTDDGFKLHADVIDVSQRNVLSAGERLR
jgi:hypothetical protein